MTGRIDLLDMAEQMYACDQSVTQEHHLTGISIVVYYGVYHTRLFNLLGICQTRFFKLSGVSDQICTL